MNHGTPLASARARRRANSGLTYKSRAAAGSLSWAFPPATRMTDTAVGEVGEDAATGAADPPPERVGMADRYTIATQQASRRGARVTALRSARLRGCLVNGSVGHSVRQTKTLE